MNYELSRTIAFEADLINTIEYLINEAYSKNAALKLVVSINHAEELLADNPFMFSVSNKPLLHQRDYREYFVGEYTIVYKVVGSTIILLRLFHQKELYELKV